MNTSDDHDTQTESADDAADHHICFVYETPVPCRFAAPIQILNTAAALAQTGARVDVYFRRLDAPPQEIQSYYDLTPQPRLRVLAGPSETVRQRRRLSQRIHDAAEPSLHRTIVVRGESGVRWIRDAVLPRQRSRTVLELHRTCQTQFFGQRFKWLSRIAELRMRRREFRAVQSADGLIFLTDGVREAFATLIQQDQPTTLLPSGCDSPALQISQLSARDLDIVYAGKLSDRKGLFDLLHAMRHLTGRQLTICGGSNDEIRDWRSAAAEIGVVGQTRWLGWLSPAEVKQCVANARVGVCALPLGVSDISERFTSPLKILECLSLGTPVVATNVAPVRAILTDGVDGLLVPPNDPQQLADGILRLLNDEVFAQRLANAGAIRAQDFSWATRASRLLEFCQRLHNSS